MRRLLVILLTVAALSALIAHAERSSGAVPASMASAQDWVRTVDGWERRAVLTATPPSRPISVHPALVAALQMGASLLVLVAFPGRAAPALASADARQSL